MINLDKPKLYPNLRIYGVTKCDPQCSNLSCTNRATHQVLWAFGPPKFTGLVRTESLCESCVRRMIELSDTSAAIGLACLESEAPDAG